MAVAIDERTHYIRFLKRSVHFLPELTPEHLVWDENAAKELLDGEELPLEVSQTGDFKERIRLLAERIPGLDADAVFKNLLASLLKGESQRKSDLMDVVRKIRSAVV